MTSNALKITLYLYNNLFTGESKFIAGFCCRSPRTWMCSVEKSF